MLALHIQNLEDELFSILGWYLREEKFNIISSMCYEKTGYAPGSIGA